MRDPIERLWSATRMAIRRKQDSNQVFNNDKAYKYQDLQYICEKFRTRTSYEEPFITFDKSLEKMLIKYFSLRKSSNKTHFIKLN